ncbi:MAG TPA: sigma-70 family RNA polymerase sigma factor [Candidatus Dormibacteraeota bacterium]|nr:sigma-70 family RNA polymerase sigma factor [Candidatus Dormibacteraeota bacterium]
MPAAVATDVGAIYERHAPEIHDFLVRTVHDHATAEDLTQAAFIRLLERGDTVREIDRVRPWLFTVAHNLAVTHVTRRRATSPIEAAFDIASGEKGPEDEALATAAAALVWDAARSLEPRQYAVLDLSVRRGFTAGEIAEVLEITAAHAAVVVHRAREALAQAIRLLVVVRQRRHCDRLAEIVPAGTDVLTPDLRASVDRHMRRCEVCKQVGARLTEPVELFAALPLLPLPLALRHMPALPHAGAVPHAAASHAARAGSTVQHAARRLGHAVMQPAALAGIAAVVVMGTGLGVALRHDGGAPATAAASGGQHASRGLGTGPGGSTGPAPVAVAPLRDDLVVVPVADRGGGSRFDGGSLPGGAPAPAGDPGGGSPIPIDGPGASPPPGPGPSPAPAPPPPLLEIGPTITVGPVGPLANPLPVAMPVHLVVSQSGSPSVAVSPPPPPVAATHRVGPAHSLPTHRL